MNPTPWPSATNGRNNNNNNNNGASLGRIVYYAICDIFTPRRCLYADVVKHLGEGSQRSSALIRSAPGAGVFNALWCQIHYRRCTGTGWEREREREPDPILTRVRGTRNRYRFNSDSTCERFTQRCVEYRPPMRRSADTATRRLRAAGS